MALRVEPLEEALPREWRAVVADYPGLTLVLASAAGFYVGLRHGRRLLSSLIALGFSFGVDRARRALKIPTSKS